MTRKDYIKIASVLRLVGGLPSRAQLDSAINGIVIVMKEDNPSFDEQRFRDACAPLSYMEQKEINDSVITEG